MRRTALVLALLPLLAAPARGDVTPHPLFCDGVVLQRDVKCPVWGTAAAGEKVTCELRRGENDKPTRGEATADNEGRWSLTLPAGAAGGPFTLTLKGKNTVTLKDVYVGDVWVCSGQSNMEMAMLFTHEAKKDIAEAKYPKIRLFTVEKAVRPRPVRAVNGQWQACTPQSVVGFSAVGYFFGRELHKKLDVPIGLINTSWGGTAAEVWTPRGKLEKTDSLKYVLKGFDDKLKQYDRAEEAYFKRLTAYAAQAKKDRSLGLSLSPAPAMGPHPFVGHPTAPAVLYNGMIKPLQPFAIKGAIWYQGESNAGKAYEYRTLFPAMIESWREDWKQGDFPFLFVQLAPWMAKVKQPQESTWAELREAQLLTARKVKNTAMAVITDVGDPADIHPRNKRVVGERLALAARAIAHGEKVVYSGPEYDSHEAKDGKVVLKFKNVGKGLEAKGGELKGFTVYGEDKKWVNAKAVIEGDTVVVSAEGVKEPTAVRYGWYNCPDVNLWNKDGLPASPFRTDTFRGVTWPKEE
jgi:sialate O-acetylesterase